MEDSESFNLCSECNIVLKRYCMYEKSRQFSSMACYMKIDKTSWTEVSWIFVYHSHFVVHLILFIYNVILPQNYLIMKLPAWD